MLKICKECGAWYEGLPEQKRCWTCIVRDRKKSKIQRQAAKFRTAKV